MGARSVHKPTRQLLLVDYSSIIVGGQRGKKEKKAGPKAGLINNINNRDFGKIGNFGFGKTLNLGEKLEKLDCHYL